MMMMTKKKKKRMVMSVRKEVGKGQREVRKGKNQATKARRNHRRRRVMGTATVKVAHLGPSDQSLTSEPIVLGLLLTNTSGLFETTLKNSSLVNFAHAGLC